MRDSGGDIQKKFDYSKKINWIAEYLAFDIRNYEALLRTKPESFWQQRAERRALALFHDASRRVPAYKDFLKKNKINPVHIRTIKDFSSLPTTDKQNYISAYPLEKRSWDGDVSHSTLAAVSSGTTGEPSFWPRGGYEEFEAGVIHETVYRYIFEIHKHKTLLIIGFPMGVYVSGVATLTPSLLVASKKYNMTVVSTGNNKNEVLRTVQSLQNSYDQIILAGHPFFLKDVIESGRKRGIAWSRKKLKLLFCSEGFNEIWRKYIVTETGNTFHYGNTVSTYGSSELLLMGHETPLSILVRNLMDKSPDFRAQLAHTPWVPNVFQYNPLLRYIETLGNDLIFTSASGTPLIRYNMHDGGSIVSFKNVLSSLDLIQPKWRAMLKNDNSHNTIWQLPFVMLGGRTDQTVVFYAANIYPEHIHLALNYGPFLKKLTGKFVMHKHYLKNMDEFLEINIELKPNMLPSKVLAKSIETHIFNRLREINMEYLDMSTKFTHKKNTRPTVNLWPYQHEKFFKQGLKPKYILSSEPKR
jgi:phenylacetate-CoA ligase